MVSNSFPWRNLSVVRRVKIILFFLFFFFFCGGEGVGGKKGRIASALHRCIWKLISLSIQMWNKWGGYQKCYPWFRPLSIETIEVSWKVLFSKFLLLCKERCSLATIYLQICELIRKSFHCTLVYMSQLIEGQITKNGQMYNDLWMVGIRKVSAK